MEPPQSRPKQEPVKIEEHDVHLHASFVPETKPPADTKAEILPSQSLSIHIKPRLLHWATCAQLETQLDPIDLVNRKEAVIDAGVGCLKLLRKEFEKYADTHIELSRFNQDIDRNVEMAAKPQVKIGLVGQGGAGKSTLINAVLDKHLLHCSSMRAGTSVITEVIYNKSKDPRFRYRAEIEIISEDECRAEFDILLPCLGDIDLNNQSSMTGSSDESVALAKIRALHPNIELKELATMTSAELLNKLDIRNVLGKTFRFHSSTKKAHQSKMSQFNNSRAVADEEQGNRKSPVYWPLVRVIRIYEKNLLLKSGICLVDLPGVADSNAARCRVTEEYIKNLSCVFIVCPITRGIDERNANELLENSFKRQAQLDGKLNDQFFSFIMTRTDDLSVSDVKRELGKHDELSRLKKLENASEKDKKVTLKEINRLTRAAERDKMQVAKINKKIRHITGKTGKSSLKRKRKHEDLEDSENKQDEAEDGTTPEMATNSLKDERATLNQQIQSHKEEITRYERQLRANNVEIDKVGSLITQVCIQERNQYSTKRVKERFAQEIQDLEEEFFEADTDALPKSSQTLNSLPVFCISSKAYHQLQGRNRREPRCPGFFETADTQIPQLQEHCILSTVPAREKAANSLLEELDTLNDVILTWAKSDSTAVEISVHHRSIMELAFQRGREETEKLVSAAIDESVSTILGWINTLNTNILQKAADIGKQTAPAVAEGWFDKSQGGLYWSTVRALCRRNGGPHKTSKKHNFDLNEDLAAKFLSVMASRWDRIFNKRISGCSTRVVKALHHSLDLFSSSLSESVKAIRNGTKLSIELIVARFSHAKLAMKAVIKRCFKDFTNRAQDINRFVKQMVTRNMAAVYKLCASLKGNGYLLACKNHIIDHVQKIRLTVFDECRAKMDGELRKSLAELHTELKHAFENGAKKIQSELDRMLSNKTPGKTLQEVVLEKQKVKQFVLNAMADLEWGCASGLERELKIGDAVINLEEDEPEPQLNEETSEGGQEDDDAAGKSDEPDSDDSEDGLNKSADENDENDEKKSEVDDSEEYGSDKPYNEESEYEDDSDE